MDNIISKLLIYGDMPQDSILMQLGGICRELRQLHTHSEEEQIAIKNRLRTDIYRQVKRLLEVATDYGFDKNLWHNYLAFLLITNENPFSITCEKVGANDGSVNYFAQNDFAAYKELFDYDFSDIERELDVDCFSRLSDYKAIGKKELMYNKNVSEKVQALSLELEAAKDADQDIFVSVTNFYKRYGVGMFGLNKAFSTERIRQQ